MHEAALMRDLLAKITHAADGSARVVRVSVWLGALSHFTPAHFAEHLAAASVGTIAEGAEAVCEVSTDPAHPDAQGVRLLSIDVA